MNTKEAKDFLADQAAQQATLDRTPLSDLERRMMYFTESDPASCSNPGSLNDEFEANCDTSEYEAKMSRLLHHAYGRLKDDPEGKRNWDQAIRVLREGDHYFLVLWDTGARRGHRSGDEWKLLGYGLLAVLVIGMVLGPILVHNVNLPKQVGEGIVAVIVVAVFLLYKYIESRRKSG